MKLTWGGHFRYRTTRRITSPYIWQWWVCLFQKWVPLNSFASCNQVMISPKESWDVMSCPTNPPWTLTGIHLLGSVSNHALPLKVPNIRGATHDCDGKVTGETCTISDWGLKLNGDEWSWQCVWHGYPWLVAVMTRFDEKWGRKKEPCRSWRLQKSTGLRKWRHRNSRILMSFGGLMHRFSDPNPPDPSFFCASEDRNWHVATICQFHWGAELGFTISGTTTLTCQAGNDLGILSSL